jgi:hypothetical protein
VRDYQTPDEITIAADDAPQLVKTVLVPNEAKPGSALQMRLFLKDKTGDLLPDGVFVKDDRTGRVLQAQTSPEKDATYLLVNMPVEGSCVPGLYNYQVTAIDETGNLRRWKESYKIVAP